MALTGAASGSETVLGVSTTKAVTPAGLKDSQATELHDSYAGKGTTLLAAADTGQTWALAEQPVGAGATMSIISGLLGSDDTDASAVAGYVDVDLGARVRRIGARVLWLSAGSTDGHVALLVWSRTANSTPFPPDSPCHLSIGPTGASFGVWDAQVFSSLWTHTYNQPLVTDGTTIYEAECIIDGDTVTTRLPDGKVISHTDSRIASLDGDFAGFEVFQDATDHFGRFVEVWADTREVKSFSASPIGAMHRAVEDRVSSALRTDQTATGVGFHALAALSSGVNNTAVGANSQLVLTSGNRNTAVGQSAQLALTTANDDTAVGYNAQSALTTGLQNTAVGSNCQLALTTGANNVAVGTSTARSLSTGSSHTIVGAFAGYSPNGVVANALTTGQRHTCVGVESGLSSTTQSNDITAVGYRAICTGTGAVALGSGAQAVHAGAVALGMSTVTTAADQIEIGARHIEGSELASAPAAPAANGWRMYGVDNGAGKTEVFIAFASGAAQQIAIEP